MSDQLSSTPLWQATPGIDEIEEILRTYRPYPSQGLYSQVAKAAWIKSADTWVNPGTGRQGAPVKNRLSFRWALVLITVLLIVSLMLLSPLGHSLAQTVTRFFRIAPADLRTEVVSLTPIPTSEQKDIYDLYSLSISETEKLAGFKVKALAELPSSHWRFHGAEYDQEFQRVSLFYSLPSKYSTPMEPVEDILLFISEQRSEFNDYYGLCPNVTITEVSINNWPAELTDGAVWVTTTPSTPGISREWECQPVAAGEAMILRWEETELKYEISVAQLADGTSERLSQADLIHLAENMK